MVAKNATKLVEQLATITTPGASRVIYLPAPAAGTGEKGDDEIYEKADEGTDCCLAGLAWRRAQPPDVAARLCRFARPRRAGEHHGGRDGPGQHRDLVVQSERQRGESTESVFNSVDEMITRSATPLGMDNYHVFFASFRAIPGDGNGMTGDRAEDTLRCRPARSVQHHEGLRWNDWKRGDGKDAVRAAIREFRPTPEAPVTQVQVAVTGDAIARSLRAFGAI